MKRESVSHTSQNNNVPLLPYVGKHEGCVMPSVGGDMNTEEFMGATGVIPGEAVLESNLAVSPQTVEQFCFAWG